MLKRVCLTRFSVKPFRQMLAEDTPPGGPLRLPSLNKIILDDIPLTALRTYYLRDMLIKRKEEGVPLETLDLRRCIASERAIKLLAEIAGDVKGPARTRERGHPALFDWRGGVTFFNEEEERAYDDEYKDDYDDESDPYHELRVHSGRLTNETSVVARAQRSVLNFLPGHVLFLLPTPLCHHVTNKHGSAAT